MKADQEGQPQSRDFAFWRAYLEILSERVTLVDRRDDVSITWHPRVVQKLPWYSDVPNTARNRVMVYDWLMNHLAEFQPDKSSSGDADISGTHREKRKRASMAMFPVHES